MVYRRRFQPRRRRYVFSAPSSITYVDTGTNVIGIVLSGSDVLGAEFVDSGLLASLVQASGLDSATFSELGLNVVSGLLSGFKNKLLTDSGQIPLGFNISTPNIGSGALRFYGNGNNNIDRMWIQLDTPAARTTVDVGDAESTHEFFMRCNYADNDSNNTTDARETNIILDRDVWGNNIGWVLGATRSGADLVLVVGNAGAGWGSSESGTADVGDGLWHHVAFTRNRSTGAIQVWVDGNLDISANFGTADWRIPDGYTNGSPIEGADLVLCVGAEKHDAGPQYQSYNGYIAELRISDSVRYSTSFTPTTTPFSVDSNTMALYHFNDGSGTTATDEAGNVDGELLVGGTPTGPTWETGNLSVSGEMVEYGETGTSILLVVPSGVDSAIFSDEGLSILRAVLSGLDNRLLTDSGESVITVFDSGLDSLDMSDTGQVAMGASDSGQDSTIYVEVGTVALAINLSGVDAANAEYTDQNTIAFSITTTGEDGVQYTEAGSFDITPFLSGESSSIYTESGINIVPVVLSGTGSRITADSGELALTLFGSGSDVTVFNESGIVPIGANLSGSDVGEFVDTGTNVLAIVLSGSSEEVVGITDTGLNVISVFVSGTDSVIYSDGGVIPLSVVLSGFSTESILYIYGTIYVESSAGLLKVSPNTGIIKVDE